MRSYPVLLFLQKGFVFICGGAADVAYSRQFADVQLPVLWAELWHLWRQPYLAATSSEVAVFYSNIIFRWRKPYVVSCACHYVAIVV